MLNIFVKCFEDFRCIAGACPDTCCAGWEVDLDEATAEKYEALPGPLGQELRSHIRREDGYTFFQMTGARCPFLNEKNLCRIILEQGEDCLSVTCREHPRFWDEYGIRQETCLSISCPEAARLLFSQPFSLVVRETDAPDCPEDMPDPEFFESLLDFRAQLFSAARQPIPFSQRLDALCAMVQSPRPGAAPEEPDTLALLDMMQKLEFTDDRLPGLLTRTQNNPPPEAALPELYQANLMEAENLLLYFLYRYVLRAVWDGQVFAPVRFSVHAVKAIFTVAAAMEQPFPEALLQSAVLFSREVEHSPENLEAIYDFLTGDV